jgi:protein tyrosine phosphatase (PTP) superfamily phosphohydrolase (DUF442 family)
MKFIWKLNYYWGAVLIAASACFGAPNVHGINNFHEVNDHLYRGAQPTAEGFKYLAGLGITTVVDLRQKGERQRREEVLVTSLGMRYLNIPMSGLTPPSSADITRILVLLEAPPKGAVFVHCKRGADRTGAVIAAYRIDHDHWANTQALEEAMAMGMAFFQLPRQSFILRFRPLPTIQASAISASAPTSSSAAPSASPVASH